MSVHKVNLSNKYEAYHASGQSEITTVTAETTIKDENTNIATKQWNNKVEDTKITGNQSAATPP